MGQGKSLGPRLIIINWLAAAGTCLTGCVVRHAVTEPSAHLFPVISHGLLVSGVTDPP
jgi:hypothetical protein